MRNLIALLLLCVAWPITATPPPASFSASYTVHKGSILLGEMHRSLSRSTDAHYRFKTETYSTGLAALFVKDRIVESSEWDYHGGVMRPLHYSYRKSGGKRELQLDQHFDWERKVVNRTGGTQASSTLPVAAGTLDKLAYQVALMDDLKQGKTELAYTLLDDDETKTYHFQVVGEETLSTPLGTLETLRIERVMNAGSKRRTTFWCAPSLNYLLVRLDQRESNNDEFSALIQSVKGLPPASASP
ncbi:MAG: DUF3108 domain-containing protein [Gammaproteobacteria bacterium]|nr:DUF3108 domain-containing protein [Gammaproteobacteria bacterium]